MGSAINWHILCVVTCLQRGLALVVAELPGYLEGGVGRLLAHPQALHCSLDARQPDPGSCRHQPFPGGCAGSVVWPGNACCCTEQMQAGAVLG